MSPSLSMPPAVRHPAEWEPHASTWIIWPHTRMDWPGKLSTVAWDFTEMTRWLSRSEPVNIIVQQTSQEHRARMMLDAAGASMDRIRFHRIPTDRSWARDAGPIFLKTDADPGRAVAHFAFTAWARYPNFQKDAQVPERVASALQLPRLVPEQDGCRVVLEGGAIEVNGRGTVLTTEECLLDPEIQVRNPGFSRNDYGRLFAGWLGAHHTIWLGQGIAGDQDTHGHVDDVCRFVNPRTLVLAAEPDSSSPNHRPLRENRERLQQARLEDGSRPEVVELPMPRPLVYRGRLLPASYANFYIGNRHVLVPTFNDPADRTALGILSELMPDRTVVGIHGVNLVLGLGCIHCLTHEEPA